MRKTLSVYLIALACTALLSGGCAGENPAVKSDPLLIAAPAAPAASEPSPAAPSAVPAVSETAPVAAAPAAPSVSEPPAKPAPPAVPAKTESSPDSPVAKVNETTITKNELDRAMTVLVAQNRVNPGSTPEELKKARTAALDQLIYAELMYQLGMKTPPADLNKQVDFKMSQNKSKFSTPAQFEEALKNSGITEKELIDITQKDVVISNYIETKIVPGITVSDAEVTDFYNENSSKLAEESQIKASHILIGVDTAATPEDKKIAKEKAETILKELKSGKDFAEAAKTSSTCPSKEQGGDLGFFGKGQMVPEFEQAAFALKPGELSSVVETQFGYHIIKVTERKDAVTPKLEELREKITTFLKGQKTQKAVFDFVTKLRKESKIEVLL